MKRFFVNLLGLIVGIIVGGLLVVFSVMAENRHHNDTIINQYQTIIEKTVNSCDGSALGVAAAQHHFDFGTHSWQWAAGAAYVDKNGDNCEALSVGIGKRIDRAVINGSISRESDSTAYGVGINGRF